SSQSCCDCFRSNTRCMDCDCNCTVASSSVNVVKLLVGSLVMSGDR
ncbi:MAG: hypothetical protein EZS28_051676, partial [Streblomastix strix]